MSKSFSNPRGDLLATTNETSSYISRLLNPDNHRQRQFRDSALCIPIESDLNKAHFHSSNPCYDWIFSSASNVHIAIDRSAFRSYTPFKTYVLAVADHRQIPVKGIGSVDLDLRRKKGSRKCHSITLENVLHAPSWMCNVFSDIYFERGNGEYEHTWGKEGVQFMKRKEQGELRTWGFTEEFCGLERLVLARNLKGRSPMLEDPDRELFSINVKWSQGQQERWEVFVEEQEKRREDQKRMLVKRDGNVGHTSQSSMASKA